MPGPCGGDGGQPRRCVPRRGPRGALTAPHALTLTTGAGTTGPRTVVHRQGEARLQRCLTSPQVQLPTSILSPRALPVVSRLLLSHSQFFPNPAYSHLPEGSESPRGASMLFLPDVF